MNESTQCHCGRDLHYANPANRRIVERLVAERGESVRVSVGGRTWLVPRHFIALHGLKGAEVHRLGFTEVTGE